jgi:hypothetical protein
VTTANKPEITTRSASVSKIMLEFCVKFLKHVESGDTVNTKFETVVIMLILNFKHFTRQAGNCFTGKQSTRDLLE